MRKFVSLFLTAGLLMGCSDPDPIRVSVLEDVDIPDVAIEGQWVVDQHQQFGKPAVDVLWVVDNSLSMREEQLALANNFNNFIRFFNDAGIDYHIGVISTGWDADDQRGRLRSTYDERDNLIKWIEPSTRDAERRFRELSLMGIDGPLEEKGRAQVWTTLGLLEDTENFGFMREDAFISVIVVSDEDDKSGDSPIGVDKFIDFMVSLKEDATQVSFSSIVGPDGGCGDIEEGADYLAVTRALGGIEHSICDQSWGGILEDLSLQSAGLRSTFPLSHVPDVETFEVEMKVGRDVVAQSLVYDFVYNRGTNSLEWNDTPPPNAKLTIRYMVDGSK
ncbi:MAG: hypothetical protein ACI9MC_001493 [Kiritimatiellia bacterium]|jgi:hypothetical protein